MYAIGMVRSIVVVVALCDIRVRAFLNRFFFVSALIDFIGA